MNKKVHRTISVKLFGGPLDGVIVEVPQGAESYTYARMFTYTYAGKDGRQVMFARQPNGRRERKFVHWYVGKYGKDPRVLACLHRGTPTEGGRVDKRGKGALLRAAKRQSVDVVGTKIMKQFEGALSRLAKS